MYIKNVYTKYIKRIIYHLTFPEGYKCDTGLKWLSGFHINGTLA